MLVYQRAYPIFMCFCCRNGEMGSSPNIPPRQAIRLGRSAGAILRDKAPVETWAHPSLKRKPPATREQEQTTKQTTSQPLVCQGTATHFGVQHRC